MSKRAEQRAEEYERSLDYYHYTGDEPSVAYQVGYEQAEKDTIERAIAWLKENANKYIVDIGVGYGEHGHNVELVVGGMCWEHLKQELEEEQ